ncbi:pyroglutamylated RF-amide peptide receptor-like [Actinia tenebrosa]|uniref:Pyroglutamylated RF-amide peptide receptor-like n=1 Tax=Actinia tenebrosa TaxID=6105 RepID=A0A6P8J0C6_ACTTE|nr:pyroglutamylated RF-amide peptide receptor-like [Actinia tenebrosa]
MSGLYADNKAAQYGVTTAFTFLVVTDLIGNTLVILIILTNKSMKSPMNYLLINLAVADMTLGAFMSPRVILSHFFTHPDGLIGKLLCKFLTGGNVAWIGGVASVATLIIISFERYISVVYPYSTRYKLTIPRVKRIVPACWILAVLVCVPLFLSVEYNVKNDSCIYVWPNDRVAKANIIFWVITFGLVPVFIMLALYSRVIHRLWFKHTNASNGTQLAILKSRKRATQMMVTVSIVYAFCWPPFNFIGLIHNFGKGMSFAQVSRISSLVLVTFNSAINPFIYTFQSETFRRCLKKLVCGSKRRNRVSQADAGRQKNTQLPPTPNVTRP